MQIDEDVLREVEAALALVVGRADQFLTERPMPNDFDVWKVNADAALASLRKAMGETQ